VHDALLRLLAKDHRADNTTAYVMRAVRNAAIDIVRSKRRQEPTEREFLVSTDATSCGISPRMLADAFSTLRPAERETIVLHVYGGMSFQEIADSRRRSINTIAAWYRRGLAKLRTVLKVKHE
jgi:RNA polymerase sigma-70 factor (ECF subfamily)